MVQEAEELIQEMDERDLETQSALTRMYVESGMLEQSWLWFRRFHLAGNISSDCYSANIDAYGERGYTLAAEKDSGMGTSFDFYYEYPSRSVMGILSFLPRMDEDDLIERELEDGIELVVEDDKITDWIWSNITDWGVKLHKRNEPGSWSDEVDLVQFNGRRGRATMSKSRGSMLNVKERTKQKGEQTCTRVQRKEQAERCEDHGGSQQLHFLEMPHKSQARALSLCVLTARAPLHTMDVAERARFRGTFRGMVFKIGRDGFEGERGGERERLGQITTTTPKSSREGTRKRIVFGASR
ncbi:hypothetical protein JHK82_050877 [Glycine max]|nr:hypothetical protein JHK86_050732 [Glycine max]KAG5092099.1 hypothetical protein JHK82_050877 [Glycine max]